MRAGPLAALVAVVTAAALGAGSVAADPGSEPAPAALGEAPASDASWAAQRLLQSLTGAPLTVTRDARGLAHLLGTETGAPLPLPPGIAPTADAQTQARAHLGRAGALFGLVDQAAELRLEPMAAGIENSLGTDRVLRFQQLRAGVPVLGGELVVVLDALGALKSISGELLPATGAAPAPRSVEAAEAAAIARRAVVREHPRTPAASIRARRPELWHLDPALIGVPAHRQMKGGLVWRTEVADRGAVRELVLVDARTGTIPLQLDLIHTARPRVVCDNRNNEDLESDSFGSDCTSERYVRPTSSAADDINRAVDYTEQAVSFYGDQLGVDLSEMLGVNAGDGKKLRSTVRFCPPDSLCDEAQGLLFDNAFWNGRGVFYGAGWPQADDIVAHELTHGVIEKTARLLYLYQSGAINESMADVFGELLDLRNARDGINPVQNAWLQGEDVPLDKVPLRDMSNPPALAQPDRMRSAFYDPDFTFVDNGGVHVNSGVGNKTAFLIADGGRFNGRTIAGLGRPQTARLFYRALLMLTSGSDYADLGGALTQACRDLRLSGTACGNVQAAVLATELGAQPGNGAAAPEADVCPRGSRAGTVLVDGFENFSAKRWSLGSQWQLIEDYARSGTFSLYGVEPETTLASPATLSTKLRMPRGVQLFLRFDHQYRLDHSQLGRTVSQIERYYDGAVLEYRIGSGPWTSASGRTWQNGPDERVRPLPDSARPYVAFGGDSNGYTSSRLDLTFLEGESARFRWVVRGDREVAFDGWTIDDVRFYACGTSKPSDVRDAKAKAKKKKIKLTWNPPVYQPPGGIETYKVVRKGGGQSKEKFNVKGSKEKVNLKKLRKGETYKLSIQPVGEDGKGPKTKLKAKAK